MNYKAMILFSDATGPLIYYTNGVLNMEDLNPDVKMHWRVGRLEMLRLGWRCILAALRR